MKFSDIPGHKIEKDRLRSMVDNSRLPHALLLEGPRGSGKFALARALAQYIHCPNRRDGDSCGQCPSCRQHEAFNHIDTIFSFPVVKAKSDRPAISNDYLPLFRQYLTDFPYMDFEEWLLALDNINAKPMIYVDEAVELIRALSYTAHSQYKIVLLWLPERLQEAAANKLLKLIEEPASDTLFVLTSDDSRGILPTIYSRLQRVEVKPFTEQDLQQIVNSQPGIDRQATARVAEMAQGNASAALRMLRGDDDLKQYFRFFIDLMRKAYTRNVAELKKWSNDVAALGRERNIRFYAYAARMVRENFLLNLHRQGLNSLSSEEANFSQRFSVFINERNVLDIVRVTDEACADIQANANARLVNFDFAISMILLLKR